MRASACRGRSLQTLVREAEEITLANARLLAEQRHRLARSPSGAGCLAGYPLAGEPAACADRGAHWWPLPVMNSELRQAARPFWFEAGLLPQS